MSIDLGQALRSGDEISLGVDPATWRGLVPTGDSKRLGSCKECQV